MPEAKTNWMRSENGLQRNLDFDGKRRTNIAPHVANGFPMKNGSIGFVTIPVRHLSIIEGCKDMANPIPIVQFVGSLWSTKAKDLLIVL